MIKKDYYVRSNDIYLFIRDSNSDTLNLNIYKNIYDGISMKLDINFNQLLLSGTDIKTMEKGFLFLLNNSKVGEEDEIDS
jgi:hypothetical protein